MASIDVARELAAAEQRETEAVNELEVRFEQVVALRGDLDINAVWDAATDEERRILVHELLDTVIVFPDHLEVKLYGTPTLNVLLRKVGLKEPENVGVGGSTRQFHNPALATYVTFLLVRTVSTNNLCVEGVHFIPGFNLWTPPAELN